MQISRRHFIQASVSALMLRCLSGFAQNSKTSVAGRLPLSGHINRVVSAGAPADVLLLAVAPEKLVGFSSFNFARHTGIPLPKSVRNLPFLGRLAGRASTLSTEGLLALKPDLVVDCGYADASWQSQADQLSELTQIPWLLLDGELIKSPEQLQKADNVTGNTERAAEQSALAQHFINEAKAFSYTFPSRLRFYAARGAHGLETGLKGSLHTEAAELLGLQNVAQIAGRHGLSKVSMENLLNWQPDIILVQDAVTAPQTIARLARCESGEG